MPVVPSGGAFKRHAGSAPEAVFALAGFAPEAVFRHGGFAPEAVFASGFALGRLFLVLLVCFVRSLGLFLLLV